MIEASIAPQDADEAFGLLWLFLQLAPSPLRVITLANFCRHGTISGGCQKPPEFIPAA